MRVTKPDILSSELIQLSGVLGLIRTNTPFFVHTMTMLRRNMLRHILRRPGAAALPDSPAEALSRFRGDVFEIPLFALWINDLLGSMAFGAIAIVTMARIDWRVTLLVVLPLIVVGVVANLTSNQVERFRRGSRRHAGIVTGFIGELFGAVQAVKVATVERGALGYFRSLNRDRMRVALRDRLFNEILNTIFCGIEDVSISLRRGTFTVVPRRNGSGKTTLLRVLLGLLPCDSGDVYWNGRKLEDPGSLLIPPNAAYTAQIPRLFSDTLRDNILMGRQATDEDILEELYLAVLEDDLSWLEKGLDTVVGPKCVKLSGGQMQRTAAARMFVRSSQLLVFDDLSSALDVETEKVLWERVFTQEGVTCLAVSHRKTALRQADNIVVMKDGRVEAQGRLDDPLKSCDEIRRIWFGNEEAVRSVAAVRSAADAEGCASP